VPIHDLLFNPEAPTHISKVQQAISAPGRGQDSALAQFLELRGHRVFEALGTVWAHYRGPFFCSLPYHRRIDPDPREIREMLRQRKVRCVRFPSGNGKGLPVGLYVCDPREYGLEKLPRQYRRHVVRGQELCEIRPIEPAELIREGLKLNLETMQRQQRYDPEFGDPASWKRFVEAIRLSPGVEVTGAYLNGRLSAYLVTCRQGKCLHMLYKMSRSEDRGLPIGHALDFQIISRAAADPGLELVENSFVSIVPNEGLDTYKRRMGFTVEPCHLSIYFHPAIAPLLSNRLTIGAMKTIADRRPKDLRLQLGARVLEGARITMTNHFPIVNDIARQDEECQHTGCLSYSRIWRPHLLFLLKVALDHLKREGWRSTLAKTLDYLRSRAGRSNQPAKTLPRPVTEDENLGLQPGDWVEVKSAEEIRSTLDAQSKHRGLQFVPREMLSHCGKQYRVHKRVEKIFLEESRRNRKLKNTVLLENVQCQGIGLDCDRCCFLFWREAWLKKIEAPGNEVHRR
jgi:hypothetical protein